VAGGRESFLQDVSAQILILQIGSSRFLEEPCYQLLEVVSGTEQDAPLGRRNDFHRLASVGSELSAAFATRPSTLSIAFGTKGS
jgi:hypothetical protein